VLCNLTQFTATKGVRLVHDVIVGTKDISLVYGFNLATRSMAEADEIAYERVHGKGAWNGGFNRKRLYEDQAKADGRA
jgi:hypothetical protein